MNSQLEIRKISSNLTFDEESRTVKGKVICFNDDSKFMGYVERIKPEAATREFLANQDLFLYFDHDETKVLGRCNKGIGNLKYDVRDDGVYYECNILPNTLGDDTLTYIRSGIMEGASFGFIVDPDKEEWYRDENGIVRRDISGFKMIAEFSVVFNPAYASTSVSCRSLDKFLQNEKRNAEIQAELHEYRKKILKLN